MTASVAIRLAIRADAIALADLSAKTFYDTFAGSTSAEDMTAYLAAAFSVAQLQAELNDPCSTFWLAEAGDRLTGYAKLRQKGSVPDAIDGPSPLELQRLYVRRDCLRQGIGSALMQACLDA
ncbi:MAG: GNAT family N-acetyltransferase, partial [Cyanobacteria bacterium J06639_1]